ncbi:hypothetical protein MNBD_GAMMA12-521 [hydrothermal vent metagenome]|uniref:TraD/TraG TraM recognition site domain-containing protein n=1 Tax=hydrothermal vent metagenome TaxID=652676 RepID=A0A3B0XXM0_9ZZZZ
MQRSSSSLDSKDESGLVMAIYWSLCLLVIMVLAPVSMTETLYGWVIISVAGTGVAVHTLNVLKLLIASRGSAKAVMQAEMMSCSKLIKQVRNSSNTIWMGKGFLWSGKHSARLYDVLYNEHDFNSVAKGSTRNLFSKKSGLDIAGAGAINYLQRLNQECYDIEVPLDQFKGHTLMLATTRAIKTRFLSLLVVQALLRSPNEAIIIIDPKGDLELKILIEQQARRNGRQQDFEFFHPAFPDQSICLNPLQNFSRPTEIASRLVDLVTKQENDDAFSAFAWRAVNVISTGLLYLGETPTIVLIKAYIDNVGDLLILVLEQKLQEINQKKTQEKKSEKNSSEEHRSNKRLSAEKNRQQQHSEKPIIDQFLFESETSEKVNGKRRVHTLIRQYQTYHQGKLGCSDINDLITYYQHDRVHASKMLASLVPLLSQLSSGTLGQLLSPRLGQQKTIDFSEVVQQHKIIYIGLDSMADAVVGSAIGQIFLADIAAVAAKRYNYSQDFSRINLFIDEAHSVCNKSLITLANQGAGAGIDLYLASQTLSDFVVALGSEEHAMKLVGNLNTLICGRIIDPWTQTLVSERFGKTHVEQMMCSQSESSGTGTGLLDWGSSWGERVSMVEVELVPASVLGRIPNLEYFALLASGSLIKGKIPVLQAD